MIQRPPPGPQDAHHGHAEHPAPSGHSLHSVSVVSAPDCEVKELDGDATWEDLQDSRFLRELDSPSAATVPMELSEESSLPMLSPHTLDARFAHVGKHHRTEDRGDDLPTPDPFASVTRNSS